MRSRTCRQWITIAIITTTAALLVLVLLISSWPLISFLSGRLPKPLPIERILWGLLFTIVLTSGLVFGLVWAWRIFRWMGWLIIAAWAAAAVAVAGIALFAWLLLGAPSLQEPGTLAPGSLDSIATRSFAIVAGLGGVAFLVIAYRRQHTNEVEVNLAKEDDARAKLAAEREVTRLFTDRFDSASEKLGSEHPAVRLAGVHALAHLADGAPSEKEVQMVIDVLCSYMRMPYAPAPDPLPKRARKDQREKHQEQEIKFAAMREVRHTIIRIIGNRLSKDNYTRWRGKDYDFTGAVFDGGDLRGAAFSDGLVSFMGADFTDGRVEFIDADFTGGTVTFTDARFTGGTVDFFGAEFNGSIVSFNNAKLAGGVIEFSAASFSKGPVDFNAEFMGSYVFFEGASFTKGAAGFVGLRAPSDGRQASHANFTKGRVDFTEASGSVPEGLCTAVKLGKRGVVVPSRRWQSSSK